MLSKIKLYAAMVAGVVVFVLVAVFRVKSWGADVERAKQAQKEREDVKTVTDARIEAQGKTEAELNEELRPWARKQ